MIRFWKRLTAATFGSGGTVDPLQISYGDATGMTFGDGSNFDYGG